MGVMPPSMDHEAQFLAVEERLRGAYGERQWTTHGSPLDELVGTVLSQHTSDTNTARSFASLRQRFPTWQAVIDAETSEVAAAIHCGGLANVKASRLQTILRDITRQQSGLNLDHIATYSLADARAWLLRLHGVGPKTAACVLLFSLGRPALPVDTHVHRVAKRLGLIAQSTSAEAAHEALEPRLGGSRDRVYDFHLNMIAHGRQVCTALRPSCDRCPLTEHCDFFFATRDIDSSHHALPSAPDRR